MTRKERILKALDGGVPDRVPVVPKIWIDLASNLTGTSLLEVIENPLLALKVIIDAGIECSVDAVRQFHIPSRRVIKRNGKVYEVDKKGKIIGEIDITGGLSTYIRSRKQFDISNPYMMAFSQFWRSREPFVKNESEISEIAVPDKKLYEEFGAAKNQRGMMKYSGERVELFGDCGSIGMSFYINMVGYERALFDLIDRPVFVKKVMEKGAEIAVERGKFNIDLGIKVLRINDSAGNMSVLSPEHWQEFIFPFFRDVCKELHSYDSSARLYCHICGNVMPIIDKLAKTGLDCIGPLDPLGGFTAAEAREKVGNSISLMGGVNTLSFVKSKPVEIISEAKECIIGAGSEGGFILGSGCVIPRDAKKENIKALVEAAELYGRYSSGKLIGRQNENK